VSRALAVPGVDGAYDERRRVNPHGDWHLLWTGADQPQYFECIKRLKKAGAGHR
jgi:hypothetical protein